MITVKQAMQDKNVFLFDFDGTIVDSMGMWGRVDMTIVERHGGTVPPDFLDILVPLSEEETAQCFLDHGCSGTVESIMNEINELANAEYANTIAVKPGAKRLIESLRESGARLGLVTAATLERILPCLERNGMSGYFNLILTCDSVEMPKSDPEIYRLALRYLNAQPEQAVFFDDSLTAIRTAKQAGLGTIGVYDDHAAKNWDNMKQAADATLTSFEECLPTDSL